MLPSTRESTDDNGKLVSALAALVGWSGGYDDLVRVAQQVLEKIDDPARAPEGKREAYAKAAEVNERLVRQYVGLTIVSGADRTGRKLTFRYPQLLQLLVARHLIAVEGWKLQQIKAYVQGATVEDLERLLPALPPAAGHTRAPAPADAATSFDRPEASVPSGGASGSEPFSMLVRESRGRAQFAREVQALRQLDMDLGAEPEDWVRFRLTPWTEVLVQESALEAWDDSLVEALAERLKHMLRLAAAKRRKPRR
jgi:hypothetical protein